MNFRLQIKIFWLDFAPNFLLPYSRIFSDFLSFSAGNFLAAQKKNELSF